MDEGLDDHVRALFATAPDEFVAARTELVKALKNDDRRDDAATIAGLRRPSWIDGALNRTAAAEPGPVAEFVDAARAARRIQQADAEGRRTDSLPDALRTVRAAQARLAKVADTALVGFGRKADLAGVTARLAQLGADPVGLELLRGGVLGIGDELAGVLVADDTGEPGVTSDTGKSGDTGAPNADDAAVRRKAIDAATRAARSAEKDAQVSATAARRAAERRDRAAAAVEAAEAAVRDAERALEQARSELTEHQTRAADAERAADEAAEAASDAAARLDDLLD